jgi:hypothetical protein
MKRSIQLLRFIALIPLIAWIATASMAAFAGSSNPGTELRPMSDSSCQEYAPGCLRCIRQEPSGALRAWTKGWCGSSPWDHERDRWKWSRTHLNLQDESFAIAQGWMARPEFAQALGIIAQLTFDMTRPDSASTQMQQAIERFERDRHQQSTSLHAIAAEIGARWQKTYDQEPDPLSELDRQSAGLLELWKNERSRRDGGNSSPSNAAPSPPFPERDWVRAGMPQVAQAGSDQESTPSLRDRIAREQRLAKADPSALPSRHQSAYELAERFASAANREAQETSEALLEEARGLRLWGAGHSAPTLDRVQQFQASRAELQSRISRLAQELPALGFSAPARERAQQSLRLSGELARESDSQFWSGRLEVGEGLLDVARSVLDVGLGLVPVVSVAKDFQELVTGRNLVTGQALDSADRALAAVGVITLGIGSEIKGVARAIEKVSKILEPTATLAFREARALLSSPKLQHVLGRLTETPELARSITPSLQKYLVAAENSAKDLDADSLDRIARRFIDLEPRFRDVPVKTDLGRVPLLRGRQMTGDLSKMTEADKAAATFGWGIPGLIRAEHRFSQGGKYGQDALYAVIDDGLPARQTILAETRVMDERKIREMGESLTLPKDFVLGRVEARLDRVLDLTDPAVIRHLNLGDVPLTLQRELLGFPAYEITQQLGYLAREYGFEAIFAKSAQMDGNFTLTLLKDVSWKPQ